MSAKIWSTGSVNAISTTLNGSITIGDNSITLTSTAGLVAPGVLCIDRVDANGVLTPTIREYISYTGISVNSITGVSRGLAGSSAQAHTSGAVLEENFSTSHWTDLVAFLNVSHDAAGKIITSTATITDLVVTNSIIASGASIIGRFPITPTWTIGGLVSLATTNVGKPTPMPQAGTWSFFSAVLRTPASGSSLVLDINKNGTSIFTDQGTRLLIPGGATFVSTASIGTKTFNSGDIFAIDIDSGGGTGSDLVVLGRAL